MKKKIIMMMALVGLVVGGGKELISQTSPVEWQKVRAPSGSGLGWAANIPTMPYDPYSGSRVSIPSQLTGRKTFCSGTARTEYGNSAASDGRFHSTSAVIAPAPEFTSSPTCPNGFKKLPNTESHYMIVPDSNWGRLEAKCDFFGYNYLSYFEGRSEGYGFNLSSYIPLSSHIPYSLSPSGYIVTGNTDYAGGSATFETEVLCYR